MPERAGPSLARATFDLDLQMDGVRVVRIAPALMRGPEDRHHGNAERLGEVPRAGVGRHEHFGARMAALVRPMLVPKVRQADDPLARRQVDDLPRLLALGGAAQYQYRPAQMIDNAPGQVGEILRRPVLGCPERSPWIETEDAPAGQSAGWPLQKRASSRSSSGSTAACVVRSRTSQPRWPASRRYSSSTGLGTARGLGEAHR